MQNLKKEIAGAAALISALVAATATAQEGVNVGGVNYLCDNRCVVHMSFVPPRVRDCCGGKSWIEQPND